MNPDPKNPNRFVADRTDGGDHLSVYIDNTKGQDYEFTKSNRDESEKLALQNLNSPRNKLGTP